MTTPERMGAFLYRRGVKSGQLLPALNKYLPRAWERFVESQHGNGYAIQRALFEVARGWHAAAERDRVRAGVSRAELRLVLTVGGLLVALLTISAAGWR